MKIKEALFVFSVVASFFIGTTAVFADDFLNVGSAKPENFFPSYSDKIENDLIQGDGFSDRFENLFGVLDEEKLRQLQGLGIGVLPEGSGSASSNYRSNEAFGDKGVLENFLSSTFFVFFVLFGFVILSFSFYFVFLYLKKIGDKLFVSLLEGIENSDKR